MKKNSTTNFILKIVFSLSIISFVSCFDHSGIDGGDFECIPVTVSDTDVINFNDVDPSFETNLVSLFHNNINVRDLETSSEFYELLGFVNLFGITLPINITDPDEALGINLPPYQLDVDIIQINDGFVIDLIQFNTPYDDEAPNDDVADLGFSALHLKTDNLKADIAVFDTNNITYTLLNGTEEAPTKISFKDPSGTIILLSEAPTDVAEFTGVNASGKTSIYGLFTTNINVSNLYEAVKFYKEVGFRLVSTTDRIATIVMPDGRHMTLTESCNTDLPYEDANHLGIARIAIVTSDIDADIARLTAAGIETYTPEAITPSGALAILRYVAFEDPDGTIVELIEYLPTDIQ